MAHGGKLESMDEPLSTVATEKGGCRALVTPYIARVAHGEYDKNGKKRGKGEHSADEPLPTVTASPEFAIVAPTLIQVGYGERDGQAPRAPGLDKPLGTVVANGKHALVAAFLAQHNGKSVGQNFEELQTAITGQAKHSLVSSHLVHLKGTCKDGVSVDKPMPTIQAEGTHIGEVRAFLIKYFGTDQDPRLEEPLHTVSSRRSSGRPVMVSEVAIQLSCSFSVKVAQLLRLSIAAGMTSLDDQMHR